MQFWAESKDAASFTKNHNRPKLRKVHYFAMEKLVWTQSRTEKHEYHANRENRELTQQAAQIRMSAKVEGVASSTAHFHENANYAAKTSQEALGSQGLCWALQKQKTQMCRLDVFQYKNLLERTQIAQKTQLRGKFAEHLPHENTNFQKTIRLCSQVAYRAADFFQNGASEHTKYRQVAPDTVRTASGASAGQSPTVSGATFGVRPAPTPDKVCPPQTVSGATFWTVSGASFWRHL